MTAFAMDVRELQSAEIDDVSGGPVILPIIAGIAVGTVIVLGLALIYEKSKNAEFERVCYDNRYKSS